MVASHSREGILVLVRCDLLLAYFYGHVDVGWLAAWTRRVGGAFFCVALVVSEVVNILGNLGAFKVCLSFLWPPSELEVNWG